MFSSFLLLLFLLPCAISYDLSIPSSEYQALYDLYNSTEGPHWHWNTSSSDIPWDFSNSSSDPCKNHWQGLLCDCVNVNYCTIEAISLSNYSLIGTLPPSISQFLNLTTLALPGNSLFGSLPPTIGNFHALNEIDIRFNRFTSSIPDSFYELTNLAIARLGFNRFSGTLSPKWTNFKYLEILAVPNNWFFGSLTSILTSSASYVHSLKQFVVFGNRLSGSLPDSVGMYQNLQAFAISYNRFTGTIPPSFSLLQNLQFFGCNHNDFYGDNLSAIFSNASQLTLFAVSSNWFSGDLPYSNNWEKMTYYFVDHNYFSGSIPEMFSRLASVLSVVVIAYNDLTGTLPTWISQTNRLVTLDVGQNYLHGNLYRGFSDSITGLYLYENEFTGSIPDTLFMSMNQLQVLELYYNQLTGTISDQFSNLDKLTGLFLSNNQFSGTLPDTLFSAKLLELDISKNAFKGTVPNLFTRNQLLETFVASSNCFHGTVPEQICNTESLRIVALNGLSGATACRRVLFPHSRVFTAFILERYIDGEIPSCLFALPKLETLHLSGNRFSGSLSESLLLSATLNDLDLSYNNLDGSIPSQVQEKDWLNLNLAYNEFNGLLLSSFSNFSSPKSNLTLKLNRLSGRVPGVLLDAANIDILDGNIFSCDFNTEELPTNDPKTDLYSCGSDVANVSMITWGFFLVCLLMMICMIRLFSKKILKSFPEGSFWHELSWFLIRLSIYRGEFNHKCTKDSLKDRNDSRSNSSSSFVRTFSMESVMNVPMMTFLQRRRGVSNPSPPAEDGKKGLDTNTVEEVVDSDSSPTQDSHRGRDTSADISFTTNDSSRKKKKKKKGLVLLWLFNRNIRKLFVIYTSIAVLMFMPVFAVISTIYQTYRYTYAYQVGALYLTGTTAGIIMFILLFLFLLLVIVCYQIIWYPILSEGMSYFGSSSRTDIRDKKNADLLLQPELKYWTCTVSYCLVGLVNGLVMVAVDILYVFAVLNLNSAETIVIELLLALIKIYFNSYFMWDLIPLVKRRLLYRFTSVEEKVIFEEIDFYHYSSGDIAFMSTNLALNNLFYPVFAILFISPNCFYNALFAASSVSSSYRYTECYLSPSENVQLESTKQFLKDGQCLVELNVPVTSTYDPPFDYSFSCSSTIYTYYIPVFVFMFLLEGILLPIGQFGTWFLYETLIRRKQQLLSKLQSDLRFVQSPEQPTGEPVATKEKNENQPVEKQQLGEEGDIEMRESQQGGTATTTVPRISNNDELSQHVENEIVPAMSSLHEPILQQRIWSNRLQRLVEWGLPFALQELTKDPPSIKKRPSIILFDKSRYIVRMNAFLAILITYGSVYPPLSAIICCSIYLISCKEEVIVGRLLYESHRLGYAWYEKQLYLDCMGIMKPTRYTLALVIPLASAVFACLIFDIFESTSHGIVVYVVFFSVSVLTLVASQVLFRRIVNRSSQSRMPSTSGPSEDTLNELWRNGKPSIDMEEGAGETTPNGNKI
jgi:hypothetical protein